PRPSSVRRRRPGNPALNKNPLPGVYHLAEHPPIIGKFVLRMKKIVPKHPLAIRWMHWINFPVLFVMIWSGMLIYWANDVFKIHLGQNILFSFFPESFYKALNISRRLAEGMAFHFVFMWVFFLNGLVYVAYTLFSGEWRYLLPNKHSFKEAWLVLL